MSKIIFFKQLLVISMTTLLISSNVIAEGNTDEMIPDARKDHKMENINPLLKADDNTLKTLEWLREIGRKQVGEASYKMAVYSMQRQDWGKAKKLISEAVAMEPDNLNYHKLAIHIAYNQNDYKMAEAYLLRILNTQKKILEEDPIELANLLDNLAIIYKSQNRYNDARMVIQKSLSINEANEGEHYPKLMERLYRMTDFNIQLGDYGEALLQMQQAVQILEKNPSESSGQEMAKAYHNMGDIYKLQKHFSDAESAYLKALELWEENTQQGKSGISLTMKSLSLVQTAKLSKKY